MACRRWNGAAGITTGTNESKQGDFWEPYHDRQTKLRVYCLLSFMVCTPFGPELCAINIFGVLAQVLFFSICGRQQQQHDDEKIVWPTFRSFNVPLPSYRYVYANFRYLWPFFYIFALDSYL